MIKEEIVRFSHVADPKTWGPPPFVGYRASVTRPFKSMEELQQAWALLLMPAAGTA